MDVENIFRVFFFIFGAMIGSFLNVCIVRLPQEKSIVTPGSHCMRCGKPVRWFDNIPILSYLILRGKCRDCGAGFSARYMMVEILTGLLFLAVYLRFGPELVLVPCFFLIGCLVIATFVDFELRIIPDQLSLYGIPVGVAASFLLPGIQYIGGDVSFDTGWFLSAGLTVACFFLVWLDVARRKASWHKEETFLFILAAALVVIQYGLHMMAAVLPWQNARFACDAGALSLQGVLVGGGVLYLMGLAGSLFIQKRVVTLIDLKTLTDRPEDLFKELCLRGYLDEEGGIQKAFLALKSSDDLIVGSAWAIDRKKIYDLFKECEEGGVMGGGDVKLMALVGAFLGWKLAIFTIILAPFFAAPVGIIEKIRTKSSAMAFGPYLAVAAFVALLWGEKIMKIVLSGYGMY